MESYRNTRAVASSPAMYTKAGLPTALETSSPISLSSFLQVLLILVHLSSLLRLYRTSRARDYQECGFQTYAVTSCHGGLVSSSFHSGIPSWLSLLLTYHSFVSEAHIWGFSYCFLVLLFTFYEEYCFLAVLFYSPFTQLSSLQLPCTADIIPPLGCLPLVTSQVAFM